MKKISVGFLVFNENDSLENTIKKAYEELKSISDEFEIWIFDNNSSDGSQQTVRNLMKSIKELKNFNHDKNVGYAQNLNAAIHNMNGDYIFVIDGDGQYCLSDIKPALRLLNNGTQVIFGIRDPRKDPLFRIVLSYFLNLISKLILNSKLKDINCGFRGFTYEASRKIKINYEYNFVGPEVYALSKINNFEIDELKINHYHRLAGVSYFNSLFQVIKSCLLMIKYLFQLRKLIIKSK